MSAEIVNSRAEEHSRRIALVIRKISDPHRHTLSEWEDELQRLIARHELCRARMVNAQLSKLLSAAILSTNEAITAACRPAEAKLLDDAAATIRRYFTHPGDARSHAARFPAVIEARRFLSGANLPESLHGLVIQARDCVKLISRILDGGEVWHFRSRERSAIGIFLRLWPIENLLRFFSRAFHHFLRRAHIVTHRGPGNPCRENFHPVKVPCLEGEGKP